jgi:2-polyprenyl-3-methyl-5-hydroxy-6-metoxy-1,4-benzoquinol methylase
LIGGAIDRAWGRVVSTFGAAGPPPIARRLSALRREVCAQLIEEHRLVGAELAALIEAGDTSARTGLAGIAERALATMRERVADEARERSRVLYAATIADQRWLAPHATEYLDDADLDEKLRQSIMSNLDSVNQTAGTYAEFLGALEPLMRAGGTTRVLDLAAGHGGFAIAAARVARERGLDLHFTASDIKREYLDLGEAQAHELGLDIGFQVQDALDLSNLEAGEFDIIVCTQSLHHFPAGLVAVMFEEAARAASRGVVFVDGCRSVLVGAGVAMYGTLRHRNVHFAHDAWVSSRRFFVPEELELLARIGPWGDGVESSYAPPAHCLLRAVSC